MKERVYAAIVRAIMKINAQVGGGQQIPTLPETPLIGATSDLDSLGLVSLIAAAEAEISSEFGVSISLIDQNALEDKDGVFKDIASLVEHVSGLVQAASSN